MGTANRTADADLSLPAALEALLQTPGPWRLDALARLLEGLLPNAAPVGEDAPPSREAIRFRAHRSMSFPPRDVVQVKPGRHPESGQPRFDVEVACFGLHGPASPLPDHDNHAILRDYQHGERVADFLDIFNHRAISLLIRARRASRWWERSRGWGDDRHTRLVDAMLALPPSLESAGLTRAELLPMAGLWHHRPRGAVGLEHVLRRALPGVPLRLETALARPVDLPEEARRPLGRCRLGHDTLVGRRVWTLGGDFRVIVGPLRASEAEAFRADGPKLRRLRALVDAWVEVPTAWDLELQVEDAAIPTARLSSRQPSTRLGRDALLGRPRTQTVRVLLTPLPDGGFDGAL